MLSLPRAMRFASLSITVLFFTCGVHHLAAQGNPANNSGQNRIARAFISDGTGVATLDPSNSYNPSGGAITTNRVGLGHYTVMFEGLGSQERGASHYGAAHAQSHGSSDEYCNVMDYDVDPVGIEIQCFNTSGNPSDTKFLAWWIPPGNGERISFTIGFSDAMIPSGTSRSYTTVRPTNSTDPGVTQTRNGPGDYTVVFKDLFGGLNGGNAIVTAVAGDATCFIGDQFESGNDFAVNVRCLNSSAGPQDSFYILSVIPNPQIGVRPGHDPVGLAFALALQPTAPSYTGAANFAHNPFGTEQNVVFSRSGAGVYRTRFVGLDPAMLGGGFAHVSPFRDSGRCSVEAFGATGADLFADVRCFSVTGAPKDLIYGIVLLPNPFTNLVQNGSFEEPVVTEPGGVTGAASIPGWQGSAFELWRNFSGIPAYDGEQLIEMDVNSNTTIFQDLATTPGGEYLISFAMRNRPGTPLSRITASWEGGVVFTAESTAQGWLRFEHRVTANGPTTRFQLAAAGTSDGVGDLLDDVRVIALTSSCPPPMNISLGANVNGSLQSSDCRSRDDARRGNFADNYSLNLQSTQTVTIAMSSSVFDTFLNVFDAAGNLVAFNDDTPPSTNSRIEQSFPAGVYTIEATSFGPGQGGNYNLTVTAPVAVMADPSSLSFSAPMGGGTPAAQSLTLSIPGGGTFAFGYSASVSTTSGGNWLSINPTSAPSSPGSKSMTVSVNQSGLGAGMYSGAIAITPTAGPSFTVPVTLTVTQPVACPPPTPIALGGTVNGMLASSDCRSRGANRAGNFADNYTLVIQAAQTVTIDLTSTSFDPFLNLFDVAGNLVASNDDSNGAIDSQISRSLPAGTYVIEATSFAPGVSGIYTLALTSPVSVAVSTPDVRFSVPANSGEPSSQTLTLSLPGGGTFGFTASATTIPSSPVSDGDSRPSQAGANWLSVTPTSVPPSTGPKNLTATVDPTGLTEGMYRGEISVNPTIGPEIKIPVNLTVGPPTACPPPTVIALGATVNGTLANTDCRSRGPNQAGNFADNYTLNIQGAQTVTIALTSSAFDTFLNLFDATGNRIAFNDNTPSSTNSTIEQSLTPGAYVIEATSFGAAISGAYTLMVTSNNGPSFTAAGVVGAASFRSGAIAPGAIISIFGVNLGPDTGVGGSFDSSGVLTKELAGTRVLFDGVPGAMFFVNAGQINVQASYSIAGKASVRMQVVRNGQPSSEVVVPVAASAPGLFTAAGSLIALDTGFRLINAANPAAPGDVIILYGTGEGQTSPAAGDGVPAGASPLQRPILPVRVTQGGVDTEILFAGSAPSFVGLFQVNLVVGDVTGDAVSMELLVGGNPTAQGLTLFVRKP